MDKVMDADNKRYISPPMNIEAFGVRAEKAQKNLVDFFNYPAMMHLNELQALQSNLPEDSEYRVNFPDMSEIETDCRTCFKFFINAHETSFEAADEVITAMDEYLQDLLFNYPVDQTRAVMPPKDSKLKTHRVMKSIRKSQDVVSTKTRYLQRGKYFDYRIGELKREYTETGKHCENDVVIVVHLCPPKFSYDTSKTNKLRSEVKLLVRGNMPLVKLRDKIFCPYDYFSNKYDFEDASNVDDYYVNKYPSSFLFIHDTFYIDRRNPKAQDISEPIREFMKKKPNSFGAAKVADITEFKIKDLNLRLGQPYIFSHIGDCEHLVIFTDLRLLHPSDPQDLEDYPIFLCDKIQSPKCCVCRNSSPSFIITESDRIPICPAFMCTQCFNEFHYEGDKRIGQFTAFHYIDKLVGEF